jgi:hypothetical protein
MAHTEPVETQATSPADQSHRWVLQNTVWVGLVGFVMGATFCVLGALLGSIVDGDPATRAAERGARTGLAMAAGWYIAGRVSGKKFTAAHSGSLVGFMYSTSQDLSLVVVLCLTVFMAALAGLLWRGLRLP